MNWCTAEAKAGAVVRLLEDCKHRLFAQNAKEWSVIEGRLLHWERLYAVVSGWWTAVTYAKSGSTVAINRQLMFMVAVHAELLLKQHGLVSEEDKERLKEVQNAAAAMETEWKAYLASINRVDDAEVKMISGMSFFDYALQYGVFVPHPRK